MSAPIVAIDGPAGSGKSTVAALVADRLGVPHLDTGAFYRAVTLACLRAGVDLEDGEACGRIARLQQIQRADGRTFLDGEDVEDAIRADDVTGAVSTVAAHPAVRDALVPLQRAAALATGGVVEGRDIGSVVLPDADLKVFLDADVTERARRRLAQQGRATDDDALDAMVAEVAARDAADREREMSPLRPADDAWRLDTTGLDIPEVVAAIVTRVATSEDDTSGSETAQRSRSSGGEAADGGGGRGRDRVVIVGRPNVGKSTLVNRILGRRVAIVEQRPGVTRDRTEHRASWSGRQFTIVDTGGWERDADGLAGRVAEVARDATADADLVLFVVDITVGPQKDDEQFAKDLRRAGVPVLLVANKVDGPRHESDAHAFHGLGIGEPWPISAAHGRGVADLLDEVVRQLGPAGSAEADEARIPRVALVGKPNVGKSSLFNRLLGQERSLVDAVPHTTRDPVDTTITLDGVTWTFIDTAGMRRRHRHGEATEYYSVDRTLRAIDEADLALFLVDGSDQISEQDQRLAAALRDAGCGIVLVVNKWDLVDDDRAHDLERELDRLLSFASWAPRINVSADTGRGLRRVVPTLARVWESYNRRIPTRVLNRLVEELVERTPPPLVHRRPLRIRYVTQAEVAPPTFVVFANADLPPAWRRHLVNQLREHHDFTGTPLFVQERRGSGAAS